MANAKCEMRSRLCDLSASSPVGFWEDTEFPPSAPACRPCGIAMLLLSSHEPLSAIDLVRKRSCRRFQISEPHPPAAYTFPFSFVTPKKPSTCHCRDFYSQPSAFLHLATWNCYLTVSPSSGHVWDVGCWGKVLKPCCSCSLRSLM